MAYFRQGWLDVDPGYVIHTLHPHVSSLTARATHAHARPLSPMARTYMPRTVTLVLVDPDARASSPCSLLLFLYNSVVSRLCIKRRIKNENCAFIIIKV